MIVAFDTNVILDALIDGRLGAEEARELILAVAREEIEGLITTNSVTDIYYIAKKKLGDLKTREALYDILTLFRVADVRKYDCIKALGSPVKDFEDALLSVCAEREDADYIVSRDVEFIKSVSTVPVKSPGDLLHIIGNNKS